MIYKNKWFQCIDAGNSSSGFTEGNWYRCTKKNPNDAWVFIDNEGDYNGFCGINNIHFDLTKPLDYHPSEVAFTRQDIFKTVPNYYGETKTGKCGAGFKGGGYHQITKFGQTAEEILGPDAVIYYDNGLDFFVTVIFKGDDYPYKMYFQQSILYCIKEGLTYKIIDEDCPDE